MVVKNLIAFGTPHVSAARLARGGRSTIHTPAFGELNRCPTTRRDFEYLVLVSEILRERNPFAVRRPPWFAVLDRFGQQHLCLSGSDINQAEIVVAIAIGNEGDCLAVG